MLQEGGGQSNNVILGDDNNVCRLLEHNQAEVRFLLGDIHQPHDGLQNVLKETTLAVCFATTWSAGNAHSNNTDDGDTTKQQSSTKSLQGRRLPKLSKALSSTRGLTSGCRVVIIDGKLDEEDGFSWQGDLRIHCPDTAPYSVATLYHYDELWSDGLLLAAVPTNTKVHWSWSLFNNCTGKVLSWWWIWQMIEKKLLYRLPSFNINLWPQSLFGPKLPTHRLPCLSKRANQWIHIPCTTVFTFLQLLAIEFI